MQAGGNFYGTTLEGGANDGGTVFEVTPGGQLTTLYSFCSQPGCTDGGDPAGGLLQANGNLYGTTEFGGSRLVGTIFSLALPQQSLTLSGPTFTAQVGVAYNSALVASGGVPPYTFSITGGSLPPGLTLNTSTGAITGTPTTAGTYSFTAQVVDSQSNTVTTNFGIVVSPTTLTLSGPTGTGQVGVLYSSALKANGGVAPYTFSIISGSLPPGLTLNTSTGAITGTPTTAGTYNFTAQVVDSQSNTATAGCSIAINAAQSCTNNGNLNGNYAFLFQGWSNKNGSGYVLNPTAGSLVFDGNGNITSGQYDTNDPVNGPGQGTLTGTYCVPANNLGTMTINPSGGQTTTDAFVLQPNGNGNIIPYDANSSDDASGIFLKQTTSDFSTSAFTGQYSLGSIGVDENNNRFGAAGAFTANGTANLTNGELDADDGGNYFNGTFSSDNFNVTPSGRGTVSFNVSGVGTGNHAFYVVNSSQLLILQIDPISQGLQTLLSGQIVQQQGLTYSDSDLNGVSVLGSQGLDTSCSPACADAELDFVVWNGSGSLSHSGDDNDGGTISSTSGSGTYSVGSNGRVAISGTGENNPIFYLTGKNAGFIVGGGGSKVQFGSMVAQSGSNFNNNSISGNYYGGSWELVSSNDCGEVDLANVSSGNGNYTGEENCGESPRSDTGSFTYTVSSDGRTVVTENGLPSNIVYIVSPSSGGSGGSFIVLPWEEGNTNPKLESFGVFPATLTLSGPTGTAQVGVGYSSALVASGGVAPYTFSITSGSLPPGLTLNTSTGAITGTPTTAGTYNFTAQVVDSKGNTASASCSIVVSSLALGCPTGTAQVGVAYSSALVASGGVAPYTFSITSGSLPPGLTLNTSTGAITGTPTTAGTYNFTAQVVDSLGNTATSSCSIVVGVTTTTTTLTTSPNPSAYGQAVTLTAVVTSSAGSPPNGEPVTFWNGTTLLGTGTLSGGSASLTTSTLPVGTNAITAVYGGDSNFVGSTSNTVNQVVTAVPSETLTLTELGLGAGTVTDNSLPTPLINCSEANGVVTGTCSASYAPGTTVILTASPTSPSTFAGWGGACSSFGTGTTCSLTMNSAQNVSANFAAAPMVVPITLPPGTNSTGTATFCPNGTNPCTDPNGHEFGILIPVVNQGFPTLNITATEVSGDGYCPATGTVLTDFDCRFVSFFGYGTDPTSGSTVTPLCYPYSNGNCIFYNLSTTTGGEPDQSLYSGGVYWQIAFNSTFTPPVGGYWSGSMPRLLVDPDADEFTPSGVLPYGTSCTTPMLVGTPPVQYSPTIYCQFDADITTFFNQSGGADPTIGGKTKQVSDVVVAFLPTSTGSNPSQQPPMSAAPGTPTGSCVNGCAPSGTVPNGATITFTEGTGGTLVVTPTTGYPTPTLTESGALPSGLTFNATTGVIGGKPANGTVGSSYPITFTATNSAGSATLSYTLAVSGFTVSGTAVSVSRGATTGNTSTITVTSSGGFMGSVTLTAAITSSPAGAQDLPTFSFSPSSSVNVTPGTPGTATLTISTTAATGAALAYPARPGARWYTAGGTGLVAFALLFGIGIPARRRSWGMRVGMLVFLVTLIGALLACGGGSGGFGNSGTTPGTYTVTVTGTSGSTTATGTVTLTVQ